MHAHFERACNKPQNLTSKLKILKSKLKNLKKRKATNFMSEFQFISVLKF